MSKVAFFNIPAHGHTNPTLGVVRELLGRGDRVTYYSYESLREKIEGTGATFVPCDVYDPQVRLSKEDVGRIGRDLAFSTGLIVDMTLSLGDALLRDMGSMQPDVIVGDSMAFWSKLIAKKLQVPFVSSTTTFAFNRHSAKVMKQDGPGLFSLLRGMPKVNGNLRRLREKGYPVRSVLDIVANDDETKTIVYTSPFFQPCAETFSRGYAFVGPVLQPAGELPEASRDPTVYVSLGTVNNDRPDFYRNCLTALGDLPYRVVVSAGAETDPLELGTVPTNCRLAHTVDQIAVLQRADVFVTHCGMNSVSEALYFGVPLVMLPQTPEQQGVANRVLELNAGVMLEKTTPEAIRGAVKTALERSDLREGAAAIQTSFRQCGGAKAAADLIEQAAKKPR